MNRVSLAFVLPGNSDDEACDTFLPVSGHHSASCHPSADHCDTIEECHQREREMLWHRKLSSNNCRKSAELAPPHAAAQFCINLHQHSIYSDGLYKPPSEYLAVYLLMFWEVSWLCKNIPTTKNTSFTRDAFQLLQFLCMQQVTAAVCVLSQWPPAVSGGQNTAVISAHTAVSLHHTTGQGTDCSQCSQLQLSLLSRAAAWRQSTNCSQTRSCRGDS